jgi:gamma-glutamyl-gamma-aminobutyrate hydrolase PuuD
MLANIDSYYDYIHLAGGIPATVYAHDEDEADAIAKSFDGLVLTGGADVDPSLYQEENTASYPGSPLIDASDVFLYHAFRKAGKPVLAVCRGIQVVAAAEGVHLIQDIPSEGYQLNHNQRNANPPLSKHEFCHSCIFSKGTRLYEIFGDEYPINSFHHQACRDIPEGFKEAGRSPDGIIEAFENGNVLFTESESTSTNRYPADGEAGLEIGATSKILKANHTWEPYSGPVKPTNPTNPTDPVGQVLIGDVTLDGKIDIRDATNLQLHVAKMTTLTGNALIAGETNNDGDLNIRDATNVQMHIAKFPVAGSLVGQYKGGGTVVDPTNPPTPTTPVDLPTDKTVVYFRNTSSWSKVNIHYWNNSNQTTTWPGMEMTLVSGNIYKYEVPNGMTGVIFNDGNGTQTGDLTMPTQHNQIYDFGTSSWSAYTG